MVLHIGMNHLGCGAVNTLMRLSSVCPFSLMDWEGAVGGNWEFDVGQQAEIKSGQNRGPLGVKIQDAGGRLLTCSKWGCAPLQQQLLGLGGILDHQVIAVARLAGATAVAIPESIKPEHRVHVLVKSHLGDCIVLDLGLPQG